MNKTLTFCVGISLVFLLPIGAFATNNSSELGLKEINLVANLILAASDEILPVTETCGVTASQSFKASGSVHAAMDGEIAAYIRGVTDRKAYSKPEWAFCIKECSCTVYSSILERVGFEKLSLEDKKIYRRVSSLAREQTSQDTKRCVRSSQTVCSSEVLKTALAVQ